MMISYSSVERTSIICARCPASLRCDQPFLRYIVRDFVYSEEDLDKQRAELDMADTTEKELWVGATPFTIRCINI
jgi:hypothetical protein